MGDAVPAVASEVVHHDHPAESPIAPPAPAKKTPAPSAAVRHIDPIDKYSALIVRGTIVGMGLVGVALFLKNSRIFAKFEHVGQIPKDMIRKEIELKGRVREILESGELRIEHEPIVKIPSILPRRKRSDKVGLLHIKLAGVDISKAGQQFISKDLRLLNKPVTFTVIKPSEEATDSVDCDVTVKKSALSRTNLNLELVRRGYARVPPPEHVKHLKALQSVPAYSRLVSRLLMSEKIADRRGVGVWERDSWVESMQSYPSQVGQIVRGAPITKFVVLLFNVTKDVILYGVKLTQQAYSALLTMCALIAGGYRRFASGVDRMTDKYNRVRQRLK